MGIHMWIMRSMQNGCYDTFSQLLIKMIASNESNIAGIPIKTLIYSIAKYRKIDIEMQ